MVKKHHLRPVFVVPAAFLVIQFVLFSFLAHISAQTTTTYVPSTGSSTGSSYSTTSTTSTLSGPLYVSDPAANTYLKGVAKFTLTGSDNVGQVRLNFVRANWGGTTPRVEWPARYDANHWAINIDTKAFGDGTYMMYATGMIFATGSTASTYYQSPPVNIIISNYDTTTGTSYSSTTSTTGTTSGNTSSSGYTSSQTGTTTTQTTTGTATTGTATATNPRTTTSTSSSSSTSTTTAVNPGTTTQSAPAATSRPATATSTSTAQTTLGTGTTSQSQTTTTQPQTANQTVEPAKLPEKFAKNLGELKSTKVIDESKKKNIRIEAITNTTISVPETPENTDQTISEDQIPTVDKDRTKAQTAIVFSGKATPNSTVYVYIFSDPIIVAVNTDADGNWVYVLDKPLDQGKHEAYVVLHDEQTQEVVRTESTAFYVSTAEARSTLLSPGKEKSLVLEDPFKVTIRKYVTYISIVIAIAFAVIIEVFIRKRRHEDAPVHRQL